MLRSELSRIIRGFHHLKHSNAGCKPLSYLIVNLTRYGVSILTISVCMSYSLLSQLMSLSRVVDFTPILRLSFPHLPWPL